MSDCSADQFSCVHRILEKPCGCVFNHFGEYLVCCQAVIDYGNALEAAHRDAAFGMFVAPKPPVCSPTAEVTDNSWHLSG